MKKTLSIKAISYCLLLLFLSASFVHSNETETKSASLNIYIDCSDCDYDFIRRDITFAELVRDRKLADVHILVSTQYTGGRGKEYTVEFIGVNGFDQMVDTLKTATLDSDTDDMVRQKLSKVFKLGLMRFVSRTDLSDDISISYTKPTEVKELVDKWNKWVFNIDFNMWMNGQKSSRSINLWNRVSAGRVTEESKFNISAYFSYNENKFDYSGTKTLSITRSRGSNGDLVFAINNHWSYAFSYNLNTSTYSNIDLAVWSGAGLEYNIYPYKESSRRQWTIQYYLGAKHVDYTEQTIYLKNSEWLYSQSLSINLSLVQPWGTINTSLYGNNYLHDFSKNYLRLNSSLSLRLTEGLSFNIRGNISRVRNQLSLPSAGVIDQDVLLRSRELATTYNYWMNVGITYSFGSIYNNIVNPRFD